MLLCHDTTWQQVVISCLSAENYKGKLDVKYRQAREKQMWIHAKYIFIIVVEKFGLNSPKQAYANLYTTDTF